MISYALLAILSSQEPSLKVSLGATTLANALEIVSSETKVSHVVKGELASEIVVLNLDNFPLDQFRTELAKACQGKWELVSGQYTLSLDAGLAKQDRDAYLANLVSSMENEVKALKAPDVIPRASEVINEVRQLLNLPSDDPQRWRLYESIRTRRPIHGLAIRVMKSLDLKQLAALTPGQKLVYSTQPNASQRRLPNELSRAVNDYASQSRDWVQISTSLPSDEADPAFAAGFATLKVVPQKVVVVVSCEYGVIDVTVSGCTQSGFTLENESNVLQVPTQTLSGEAVDEVMAKQPFQLSDNSRFLAENTLKTLSLDHVKLAHQLLGKPTKNDPLSYHPTEELRAVAKSKGQNLLAIVPDGAYFQGGPIDSIGKAYISLFEAMRFESKGNLLIGMPHFGFVSRSTRTDRNALEKFNDEVSKGEPFDLALGRFALTSSDPLDTCLGFWLGNFLSRKNIIPDIDFLRLLVSLPDKSIKQLKDGAPVPYSSLPEGARNLITKILYLRQPDFYVPQNSNGEATSPLERLVDSSEILTRESLQNCMISGSILTNEVLWSEELSQNAFSSAQLGYLLANPVEVTEAYGALPTKWTVTSQDEYLLEITIGSATWTLYGSIIKPSRARPLLMSELPQKIRDEIEASRKEALEAIRNAGGSQGTQRTNDPPPPPR